MDRSLLEPEDKKNILEYAKSLEESSPSFEKSLHALYLRVFVGYLESIGFEYSPNPDYQYHLEQTSIFAPHPSLVEFIRKAFDTMLIEVKEIQSKNDEGNSDSLENLHYAYGQIQSIVASMRNITLPGLQTYLQLTESPQSYGLKELPENTVSSSTSLSTNLQHVSDAILETDDGNIDLHNTRLNNRLTLLIDKSLILFDRGDNEQANTLIQECLRLIKQHQISDLLYLVDGYDDPWSSSQFIDYKTFLLSETIRNLNKVLEKNIHIFNEFLNTVRALNDDQEWEKHASLLALAEIDFQVHKNVTSSLDIMGDTSFPIEKFLDLAKNLLLEIEKAEPEERAELLTRISEKFFAIFIDKSWIRDRYSEWRELGIKIIEMFHVLGMKEKVIESMQKYSKFVYKEEYKTGYYHLMALNIDLIKKEIISSSLEKVIEDGRVYFDALEDARFGFGTEKEIVSVAIEIGRLLVETKRYDEIDILSEALKSKFKTGSRIREDILEIFNRHILESAIENEALEPVEKLLMDTSPKIKSEYYVKIAENIIANGGYRNMQNALEKIKAIDIPEREGHMDQLSFLIFQASVLKKDLVYAKEIMEGKIDLIKIRTQQYKKISEILFSNPEIFDPSYLLKMYEAMAQRIIPSRKVENLGVEDIDEVFEALMLFSDREELSTLLFQIRELAVRTHTNIFGLPEG